MLSRAVDVSRGITCVITGNGVAVAVLGGSSTRVAVGTNTGVGVIVGVAVAVMGPLGTTAGSAVAPDKVGDTVAVAETRTVVAMAVAVLSSTLVGSRVGVGVNARATAVNAA